MEIKSIFDPLFNELPAGAVTIGNFDGVHIGHEKIINRLSEHAHRLRCPSIVFTFDPHPAVLLHPEQAPRPLTWKNRKARLLDALGVDIILFYPTNRELLSLTAGEFFEEILVKRMRVKALVEGDNFVFGRDRMGDSSQLQCWASQSGIELDIVPGVTENGVRVSSSLIRKLIAEGNIDQANKLLTAPYRIRGMVVHGDARGRTIGFPTANLEAVDVLLPGDGAYIANVMLTSSQNSDQLGKKVSQHRAMVHIGPNVTFNQTSKRVEVHILDFASDIYGKVMKVDFLQRIRGSVKFDSIEQLRNQLEQDKIATRNYAD